MGLRWLTRAIAILTRNRQLLLGLTVVLYIVLTCISMVIHHQRVHLKRDTVVNIRNGASSNRHWRRQIRDVHNDWNRTVVKEEEKHSIHEGNEDYDSLEHEYGLFVDTDVDNPSVRSSEDGKTKLTYITDNVAIRDAADEIKTDKKGATYDIMNEIHSINDANGREVFHKNNTSVTRLPNINKNAQAPLPTIKQSTQSRLANINQTAKRRLPQAIIVGVKKCGTRALLEYLRIHPDIRATGPETHFFDRNYHRGLDWYRSEMPTSLEGQITMEKTPRYFVTSEVPRRVYDVSRDMRLVVVVRDPVTRAISDFTQAISKELPPLNKVTFAQKAFRRNGTGDINTHWSGIKTGFYAQHVKRWLDYFPAEHIHFVSGENLIVDPAEEVKHVEDFLGLKRVISDKHFYFNETKGFPCLKKHEGSPVARCFNSSKGRRHQYVDSFTIKRLKSFFKPYNEDFYKLAGRDFGWE